MEISSTADDSTEDYNNVKTARSFTLFTDPRKLTYRYTILALLAASIMCMAFSADMPAALESTIIKVAHVDITQYELLYSLYSWPNVFLAVIGGVLIDRVFGLRLGLLLFVTIACIGQLLVAMGGFISQFWLMAVGRFVYGGGNELAINALELFVATLFRDRELSFVFGVLYGAARLSTTLTLNFSSKLYTALHFNNHSAGLGSVLLFGFGLNVLNLLIALVISLLDRRREKAQGRKREKRRQFKLRDLKDFSLPFWVLVLIGLLYYIPVTQFTSLTQIFFEQKYQYSRGMANFVNGIVFIVPVIAYPTFGLLFDWTGYKLFWGMFAAIGTLSCHLICALTTPVYFIPIITALLLGLFYSMFTIAVWPLVFLLVPVHQMGTAYGILSSSFQLGQAVGPMIAGQIVDKHGYMLVEFFFVCILWLSYLLLVALWIISKGSPLNMSGRKRRLLQKLQQQRKQADIVLDNFASTL